MSESLIERLARDHTEHLRWLQARFRGRLSADEAEDVLQAAYAKALAALGDRGQTETRFESYDKARAWLRQIASRVAIDNDRARNGRYEHRAARPQRVPFEDTEGALSIHDDRVDIEAAVVDGIERRDSRAVILRALKSLPDEHRQLLKLRYGAALEPQAIMYLHNLSRRQHEGRHTRAVKAFATALAKQPIGPQCGQTRLLLKRHADGVLDLRARRATGDHLEACLSCRVFARDTRTALAAMPLPIAIAAWKLDALQYFTSSGSPTSSANAASPPFHGAYGSSFGSVGKAVAAHKLSLLAVSVVAGVGGASAAYSSGTALPSRPAAVVQAVEKRASSPPGQAQWANSETRRRALERAARRAQQLRQEARRRR